MCFAFCLARNNCPSYSGRYYHRGIVEISISATKEATLTFASSANAQMGRVGLRPPTAREAATEIYEKATESAGPLVTSEGISLTRSRRTRL